MNKLSFKKLQYDFFGGVPSHSQLVKSGIARVRLCGKSWGRPPKNNSLSRAKVSQRIF